MTFHPTTLHRKPGIGAAPAIGPGQPVVPQSVSGRFRRLKWAAVGLCLSLYYVLPFLRYDRGPGQPTQAILFDLAQLRFHLFGLELRPQELYLVTGLLVLATIVLVLSNVVAGRIWCGFFCPQTVWTDLFLWVERQLEGDRRERLRQLYLPMTPARALRRGVKHAIWLAIAAGTGGAFVLYFADAPSLLREIFTGEASSVAYGAVLTLTLTTYTLAGFAREKMCTYMCPWPRLQGAVWDAEAFGVAYRDYRGEARMSAKKATAARANGLPAGDCVDCMACVNVCPMGIDIREGPNLACINCGLCVDACDTTMQRLDRPRGLIDYESWTNIERGRRGEVRVPVRLVRAKTVALALAGLATAVALVAVVATRATLSLSVAHERNPVAVELSDGRVRNAYEIRLSHVAGAGGTLMLSIEGEAAGHAELRTAGTADPQAEGIAVLLDERGSRRLRVTVTAEPSAAGPIAFRLTDPASGESVTALDFFKIP